MILDLSRLRRRKPEPRRRRQDGDDPAPPEEQKGPGWFDACCLASCLLDLFAVTALVSLAAVGIHRAVVS